MPWPQLFFLILLIALNGFLVMAELAIVSSRPARLQMLANDGRPGALAALSLNADFSPLSSLGSDRHHGGGDHLGRVWRARAVSRPG